MKKIIVPTDYSDNAANAMHYAAALAQATNASLVLYHAFAYPIITTDVPYEVQGFIDEVTESDMRALLDLKRAVEKQYGIEVRCISQAGSVSYHLQEIVREEKADLVVMGLRGSNPAVNILMGSTTFEVMRQGKIPLLIIPKTVRYSAPKRILFACDNPFVEKEATVRPLRDIAAHFSAEIEVYMVMEPQKASAQPQSPRPSNLEQHFERVKHVYTFEQAEGVRESILQGIRESDADMLAMIPRHRSIWQYLFGKSDTHSIALQTSIPMLVLAENPD
jgi:nucleotide-binding universal stress UspA family protein